MKYDKDVVSKLWELIEEYRVELESIKKLPQEPIAVVGMACRFPGGANNIEDFWSKLLHAEDLVSEIPSSRWDAETFYDADPEIPNKMYTKMGGFLDVDVSQFDAEFFHISPKEAQLMDPQQRFLLEVTQEALEHAGIAPSSLNKKLVGFFLGQMNTDYMHLLHTSGEVTKAFVGTGNAPSATAGRISYTLGLQGPCLTINTACSSSLVALNSAIQSVHEGESEMAIVAGVNLILSPEPMIQMCQAKMLSLEGHCKTFDASADGYTRGEGCGVIVLKRLSAAQKDQDTVLALVTGSSVNQDGASSGLTVPNAYAQARLIRQAMAKAGVTPDDIDYIEAHGTGTSLGDPIEFTGLTQVFSSEKRKDHPLIMSSVKTNVGHLESAAGVIGIIKTILSLQHDYIPPHLHLKNINPKIDLLSIPAEVPTQGKAWSKDATRKRRAGISSFGFSGTNAHVILEEAPAPQPRDTSIILPEEHLFVLSAKSKYSLKSMVASYREYLSTTEELVEDICYTAAVGRSQFNHRIAFVTRSKEELLEHLQSKELVYHEVSLSDELVEGRDTKDLYKGYLEGKSINWAEYYAPYLEALRKVSLPTYAFDRQRYWIEPKKSKALYYGAKVHELLGTRLPGYSESIRFLNVLDVKEQEYLKSHVVFEEILIPGAGFIESAVASGYLLKGSWPIEVREISLLKPLRLFPDKQYEYQVSLNPNALGYDGRIDAHLQEDEDWNEYVNFNLYLDVPQKHEVVNLKSLQSDKKKQDITEAYAMLSKVGLEYGPEFQVISKAYMNAHEALVLVELQEGLTASGYCMHPTLLDGAFQAIALLVSEARTYIPATVNSLTCYHPLGSRVWVKVTMEEQDAHTLKANFAFYGEEGVLLAQIEGFRARAVDKRSMQKILHQEHRTEVYIEGYEEYRLPEGNTEQQALIRVYTKSQPIEDWSKQHVLMVYEGVLEPLVLMAQRALKEPPLSLTVLVDQAFAVTSQAKVSPEQREAIGFWRTLAQEAGSSFPCYLIDSPSLEEAQKVLDLISQKTLPEPEVIVRGGHYFVPRLYLEEEDLNRRHLLPAPQTLEYLASESDIESLHWARRPEHLLGPQEIRVRIEATALNFRDVLNAMDLYPGDAGDLGCECAGEVLAVGSEITQYAVGDRVVVMGQGLFGKEVVVHALQACALPKGLSPIEGATIPVVFLTANYALNHLAQIKEGQKILIHTATGGVGLAAISFAQLVGAEIYATASRTKQSHLRSLGIQHIYDSRNIDFGAQILKDTQGSGVDVVLNSLTSEGFIESSLSCLKQGGTFLEIGKLHIYSPEQMDAVRPDVAYHVIAIDKRMKEDPAAIQKELSSTMKLFSLGKLKPLPIKEFALKEVKTAFHYLQQAQHVGKVVLRNPQPFQYKVDASYLITGGTGSLGQALVQHMIAQGVKCLILTSRQDLNEAQKVWIQEQRGLGVDIKHYAVDVADEQALSRVFDSIADTAFPLKGIFHAAGLLHDGMLMNLTEEDFSAVMKPKILGSLNLDRLSRKTDLDFLVFFSSVASLLGSAGQANYAAANAFMDGLAQARRQEGLPALSINWGPFASVGMAAHLTRQHSAQGMLALNTASAFDQMDALLSESFAQVGLMRVDWHKVIGNSSPYLSHLIHNSDTKSTGEWVLLLEATSEVQREEVLMGQIKKLVADILHVEDASHIDGTKGFFDMGMDSLMAVDLKNKIQEHLAGAVRLTNTFAFDYNSVKAIRDYLLEFLQFKEKKSNHLKQKMLEVKYMKLKEKVNKRG